MNTNMDDILFLCPMCENENTDAADGGFPCHCSGVSETPGFVSHEVIVREAFEAWDFSASQVMVELKRRAQAPLTDKMASEMIATYQRNETQIFGDNPF